jgi:hypothetical protein
MRRWEYLVAVWTQGRDEFQVSDHLSRFIWYQLEGDDHQQQTWDGPLQGFLTSMGLDGWELVSATQKHSFLANGINGAPYKGSAVATVEYVLKREISTESVDARMRTATEKQINGA